MRVFKARMMYFSACGHSIRNDDGSWNEHPHWFEIAGIQDYGNTVQLLDL